MPRSILHPPAATRAKLENPQARERDPRKWRFFDAIGYKPRVGQLAYHNEADRRRFLGFFCYPRGGKSYSAAYEIAATWTRPDYHCWVVAPKYELGSKEFGYVWAAHATQRTRGGRTVLSFATRKVFNVQGGDMEIRYPWGWFLRVKTADNPQDLLAEELDELILAEAARIPESVWDRHLMARVAKRKGRVHVPTTPAGTNWIYDRFYVPGRPTLPGGDLNPAYDPAYWSATVSHLPDIGDILQQGVYEESEIERARREMAPDVFLEQFGGQFVSYSGLVWRHLHPGRHGEPPTPIPTDWDVVVAVDPGARAPTGVLFGAWDRQRPRHLHLWHCLSERQKPITWIAEQIHAILGGRRPYAVAYDPSALQAGLDLGRAGLPIVVPRSRVFQDGYDAVTTLIETGRIHVHQTPVLRAFWAEQGRYQWKDSEKGARLAANTTGEDHLMDCLRMMALVHVPELDPEEVVSPSEARLTQNERVLWDDWAVERERLVRAHSPDAIQLPEVLEDPAVSAIFAA